MKKEILSRILELFYNYNIKKKTEFNINLKKKLQFKYYIATISMLLYNTQ